MVKEINLRARCKRTDEVLRLIAYYPEHKVYFYTGSSPGTGLVKQSAVEVLNDTQ